MPAQFPPKILLLIPHLGGGGAERVAEHLARGLSSEKYELHLGLVTQPESAFEAPPARLRIHGLRASRVRAGGFALLRLVRRLKPDIILSGMAHLNFLVLLLRPFFPRGVSVLVRQNGTASAALSSAGTPWYTRLLYLILYRRADRIICQTQAMADDLAREFGIAKERLTVLPNPVDVEAVRASVRHDASLWSGPGPHLLAVGRLAHEKGFDLLLRAMAAVRKQFPDADLVIAGAGAEEAALKAESHALGVDSAVRFAGHLARPWQYFPEATLFVLPSRQEGLPNALLEAAAGGLPLVALPASDGLTELLRAQPGVWLADALSEEALIASLLSALESLRPGERFPHAFIEAYRIDRALRAYEQLIDETLVESGRS